MQYEQLQQWLLALLHGHVVSVLDTEARRAAGRVAPHLDPGQRGGSGEVEACARLSIALCITLNCHQVGRAGAGRWGSIRGKQATCMQAGRAGKVLLVTFPGKQRSGQPNFPPPT